VTRPYLYILFLFLLPLAIFSQSKPQEYTLTNIESLNTKHSEFCATGFANTLVYTGQKEMDLIEYSNDNGQPSLIVLSAKATKDGYGKASSFSKDVNTSYHDGPLAFSADASVLYLTRVSYVRKTDKSFVNYAKLYTLTKQGKGWSEPVSFPYNSDAYSCAHASISADGNTLFFASDMPGGFGGKDIWMCKRNGDSWDKPVNLGSNINTGGDEMFPYIRQDGILFFSSNGLPGLGGLDVFSAGYMNSVWLLKRNEGLNLNGSADDFGISFMTDSTGYVSSNREGGKGKDDIYSFHFKNKYTRIEGNVLLTKNGDEPAKNVNVFLLNAVLQRVDSTKTDEKGYFAFNDLEADKIYLAQLENDDVVFKNKSRYYLADKDGKVVRVTHKQNGMNFVFRNLPVEKNSMPDLYDDDESDVNMAGNIVFGSNPTKPLAGKKITIVNKFNDIVEETTTDELGAFAFRNLLPDQDYVLTIEDSDLPENVKIILTNKKGKEIKVIHAHKKGKFDFKLLATDKTALDELLVEDSELVMNLKGSMYDQDKHPLANTRVTIFDKDKVIQNLLTDEKGRFEFRNLNADTDYLFSLDDTDNKFTGVSKIFIADSKGRIYKELAKGKNNKFEYHLLEVDKSALGDFSVDDPWLTVLNLKNKGDHAAMTIVESVTYEKGGYSLDEAGANILDKIISVLKTDNSLKIELSSHTDSQGSDQYNLQLSQKRAKAAVDYLVAKGISKDRLTAIGYGETRLLNACTNGVECTDEQHGINRRTEFKILDSQKP
jgi:outer membrane protein OmpA-like peptidoglycan-associated protein